MYVCTYVCMYKNLAIRWILIEGYNWEVEIYNKILMLFRFEKLEYFFNILRKYKGNFTSCASDC